ncbi:patatin-like phospholipase family protein [Novipirellula artificiosorum]|uniref:NTE family protein RssA n=1 Tax=Novipirellula artificiosorum TaxID=2528016 RepID=A0A5C6D4Z6_9BACT|nr:cyclic nucleotide-binding and patatin-like phospholipase domain-containing protein [Novipirellula artificiosorum]TWU30831.1 NTE family protein RssA [Novipirellula artificiosorum]
MTESPDRVPKERISIELKRLPWAKDLSETALREFAEVGEWVQYQAGDYVHRAEEPMKFVYFIVSGRLQATLFDSLGNQILEKSLVRGSVFGLFSVAIADQSRTNVVATEASSVIRLELQTMLKIVAKHADLQMCVYRLAAGIVKQIIEVDRTLSQPSVVGMVHQSEASRPLTRQLLTRLQQIESHPCVATDDPQWRPIDGVPSRVIFKNGELFTAQQSGELLKEWSQFGRIFIDLRGNHSLEHLARMFSYVDAVLWCVRPDDAKTAIGTLRALQERVAGLKSKVRLVWLLDNQTQVAPHEPEQRQLVERDFKVSFESPSKQQSRLLQQGIERIIHYLRGIQIGLALGGGAARGMAHLGVLKALEQNGIVIDMLAGTSAGAMTGTVYASGMDADYAVECFKTDLSLPWAYRQMPGGGYWYLLRKYRKNKFDPMLRKYLGQARLEQLAIPMLTVTVDLVEGVQVVRGTGDATHAILESINLPVLSNPRVSSGRALVDGGLVNNIPADVLVENGCNFVLASSVTAQLEQDFMDIRSARTTPKFKLFSALQVLMRGQLVQAFNMNAIGVEPADFVIESDVSAFDLSEFSRADEMAIAGAEAANESAAKLKQLLSQLDPKLFPPS